MNIYLLSQDINNGFDTYSDAVVVANHDDEARHIHPGGINRPVEYWADEWVLPQFVTVEYIGVASARFTTPAVICASYRAG
jgi:hypothetical protein